MSGWPECKHCHFRISYGYIQAHMADDASEQKAVYQKILDIGYYTHTHEQLVSVEVHGGINFQGIPPYRHTIRHDKQSGMPRELLSTETPHNLDANNISCPPTRDTPR